MPCETNYDIILLGSSPINMLKAYTLSYRYKVAVFEKAKWGGAWSQNNYFGYAVDNGPHLLYYNFRDRTHIFQFLTDMFKIDFELHPIPPRGESRRFFLHLVEDSFLVVKRGVIRHILFLCKSVFLNLRHLLGVIGLVKKLYYYRVVGGSIELTKKMYDVLKNRGVELVDEELVKIEVTEVNVIVTTQNSGQFTCMKVISTYRASLKHFVFFGRDYFTQPRVEILTQFILLVSDVKRPRFSYFKFIDNPNIFIAADISNTASPKLPIDTYIIGFALQKDANLNDQNGNSLLNELKKKDLMSENAQVVDSTFFEYRSSILGDESCNEIMAFAEGKIEFLQFNNLMTGFEEIVNNYTGSNNGRW